MSPISKCLYSVSRQRSDFEAAAVEPSTTAIELNSVAAIVAGLENCPLGRLITMEVGGVPATLFGLQAKANGNCIFPMEIGGRHLFKPELEFRKVERNRFLGWKWGRASFANGGRGIPA